MAKLGVGFNKDGKYTTFPSVFVSVNADDLQLRSQTPTGIVAIIAKGAGFFPPKVATPLPLAVGSPSRFIAPSELLTSANLAVPPFADLDRGPGQVLVVPLTPATPATILVKNAALATLATITTQIWGLLANSVLATLTIGAPNVLTLKLPTVNGTVIETYSFTTIADLVAQIGSAPGKGRAGFTYATFALEGTPTAIAADTPFTGGTEPAATSTDLADALNALNPYRVNAIHVASSDTTYWAMLQAYVTLKRCRGFVGSDLKNWNGISNRQASMATLTTEAAGMNSRRMMHCGLGVNGLPGYLSAARWASLAGSVDPSQPMTFKHLDVQSLEALLDIDTEVGGIQGLILNGLAVPVPDPTAPNTFLLSRGISTMVSSDNLYDREQSVLAAVDALEDLEIAQLTHFLGNEGSLAVVTRAEEEFESVLLAATDPAATVRINGYDRKSIVATLVAQLLTITGDITPIPPINFINLGLNLKQTKITVGASVNLNSAP
jgi:hypothetical protein